MDDGVGRDENNYLSVPSLSFDIHHVFVQQSYDILNMYLSRCSNVSAACFIILQHFAFTSKESATCHRFRRHDCSAFFKKDNLPTILDPPKGGRVL